VILAFLCNIFVGLSVVDFVRKMGGLKSMKHLLRTKALQSLALSFALVLFASSARTDSGPFAGLAGNWSGGGTITLGNGTNERIRCRATYSVAGDGNILQQSLRCASDSYKFELSSNVNNLAGQLSGTWNESSRNMSGMLFGDASPGRFQVVVTSPSFSANLSLTTHGDRQSVSVTAPPGGQLVGASIALSRGK
jgi:hypothetical protein